MTRPLIGVNAPATDKDRPYHFMTAAREFDLAAERFVRAMHQLNRVMEEQDDEIEREHVRSVVTSMAALLARETRSPNT